MASRVDTTQIAPRDVVRVFWVHRARWIVPTILATLAAGAYAWYRPDVWKATLPLVVRNEATKSESTAGRFAHADEMKTTQETVLELGFSRSVLTAALTNVGPPKSATVERLATWPTAEDIESLRQALEIVPPGGATFGATEIFYLTVEDTDPARAEGLATAICDQLDARFGQVRDSHAASVILELEKSVKLAEENWRESNDRLAKIESEVGGNLTELRTLSESTTSVGSDLRRKIDNLDQELLQARTKLADDEQLLALLNAAQSDSGKLLATPNRLLDSQPALRKLKDGLLDAQLATARYEGTMTSDHPHVAASRAAALEVAAQIDQELEVAIRGLGVDLDLSEQKIALLEERLHEARTTMDQLASLRLAYSNLLSETRQRLSVFENAQRSMAEAVANQASVKTASLVTRLDTPDLGVGPVGLSRANTVALGFVAGLISGFGLVLLTCTLQPPPPTVNLGVASIVDASDAAERVGAHGERLLPARKRASATEPFPTAHHG